eukprot:3174725-Pyramimonas_sp.AAC.2
MQFRSKLRRIVLTVVNAPCASSASPRCAVRTTSCKYGNNYNATAVVNVGGTVTKYSHYCHCDCTDCRLSIHTCHMTDPQRADCFLCKRPFKDRVHLLHAPVTNKLFRVSIAPQIPCDLSRPRTTMSLVAGDYGDSGSEAEEEENPFD